MCMGRSYPLGQGEQRVNSGKTEAPPTHNPMNGAVTMGMDEVDCQRIILMPQD